MVVAVVVVVVVVVVAAAVVSILEMYEAAVVGTIVVIGDAEGEVVVAVGIVGKWYCSNLLPTRLCKFNKTSGNASWLRYGCDGGLGGLSRIFSNVFLKQ